MMDRTARRTMAERKELERHGRIMMDLEREFGQMKCCSEPTNRQSKNCGSDRPKVDQSESC